MLSKKLMLHANFDIFIVNLYDKLLHLSANLKKNCSSTGLKIFKIDAGVFEEKSTKGQI